MDAIRSSKQFDKWSQTYDHGIWSKYFRRGYEKCASFINKEGELSVLDVGCGTASLLPYLLRQNPDIHYTGLDLSRGMIDIAQQRYEGLNIKFQVGDVTTFSTSDRYDYIFCLNSFHHYEEHQEEVLAKFYASLKPGGELVLLDPIKDGVIRKIWSFLLRRIFFNEPSVVYLTSRRLGEMLNKVGFEIKAAEYLVYVVKLTVAQKVG